MAASGVKIDKRLTWAVIILGLLFLAYFIYNELDKRDTINIGKQVHNLSN